MNKKILGIFVGVFALALVSAGIVSYLYSQEIILNGNQVEINGLESQTILCDIGAECPGSDITIENDLNMNALMSLSSENSEGASIKYVSTLTLTKKNVDFNANVWTIPVGAETVEVEYTVAGESFSAEVIGEGNSGYVLVYYADNDDRFANPGETVLVENVLGNLPSGTDDNVVNDYSLEYPTTPHGAKIWYVPETAVPNGVVDWSRASEFLFETELIQYNVDGEIIVYPTQTLVVTPVAMIEAGLPQGDYNATANVARLA